MMIDLSQAQSITAASGLILFWALESWLPFMKGRRERLRHAARNLTLGLLNAGVLALVAAPLIARLAAWAEHSGVGLLHLVNLPVAVTALPALLLLDGWMYLWHRANHRLPLLWRFHRVHHSDTALDVTSAVRFHTGEILISSVLRLALVPLLGVSLWQILLYDALLLPVIQLHHSNVRFPERWDRWLRVVIVSPAMHRVHHSRIRVETDSNYSSIFSFWDRAGRSFRLRRDVENIRYGLDGYDPEEWQRLTGLLQTPFTASPAEASQSRPGHRKSESKTQLVMTSGSGQFQPGQKIQL
ncbi:MAG TPA: sterol desaturase family protein [Blastocatellia bacterium]|nr:sterol desaturase family protein [Blastocatellia bacterium]